MATKLYLRDSNTSGAATSSDDMHDLLKAAANSVVQYVKSTTAGTVTPPTAATQFTKSAGGTVATFATAPLVGVTISGTVTFNLWAFESAAQANATITAELLRLDSAGAVVSIIASCTLARAELGTTSPPAAANNWNPSVTSRTLSTGDRLGVRVYIDDGSGVTMASGRTVTMNIDGGNGANANGDSWVQVNETLNFAYRATPSETVSISESLSTVRAAKATGQSETVSLSESTGSVYNAKATGQAETVSVSESSASAADYVALLSETVSVAETESVVRATVAALLETVSIDESQSTTRAAIVALDEEALLEESLAAFRAAVVALSDELEVAEGVDESYEGGEEGGEPTAYQALLEETVTVGESVEAEVGTPVYIRRSFSSFTPR